MSVRRPIWKQRTSFSKDRNVSVTLWGPGTYEGHATPPSIALEEGKREGDTWRNTRITLTIDKCPNIIENLRIAYAKALEIQVKQTETESDVARKELAKPTDQIEYLKNIVLEGMKTGEIYPKMKLTEMAKVDEWVQDVQAQTAINQLLEEGKIRPKYDNLTLLGFTKAT
jgi:hypothetical protein